MTEFMEILRDRLRSPLLRIRLWKHRRLKLRNIKVKWKSQQEHRRIEALLEQYGNSREIMEFEMLGKIPRRLR